VIYNGDQIDAATQDGPFSPDNMTTRGSLEAIQEDATSASFPELVGRGRDGGVWLVDGAFTSGSPTRLPRRRRIAELAAPAPGVWESSGIINFPDRREDRGRRNWLTFLLDVQAHESAPPGGASETVEDGQLLLLRGRSRLAGG
jgi:hypothetical protein